MIKIIATTGTKGKTTVTRMVEYVLRNMLDHDILRVDTDGHYINGRQKSTNQDSLDMKNHASTVCPGRYIIDLYRKDKDGVAVLECALGCGHPVGMGFRYHDVGVFTNVYEDHINNNTVRNKRDIFKLKSFIIKQVSAGGYLVANYDDALIAKNASKLLPVDSYLLPFGKEFKYFDATAFLKDKKNRLITYDEEHILLKQKGGTVELVDYAKIPMTYQGRYLPSVYNLMAVYGALLAFFEFDLSLLPRINELVGKFAMDKYGARLVNIQARDRIVIIDFAHEKESLREIARLGHQLGRRVVGVLRLAPDRTNAKIKETAVAIAGSYDKIVIYDKIDGEKKEAYHNRRFDRKAGEVSKIFYDSFIAAGKSREDVERIVVERDAIRRAKEISRPEDVIIVISGDDHKETYDSVKENFCASDTK